VKLSEIEGDTPTTQERAIAEILDRVKTKSLGCLLHEGVFDMCSPGDLALTEECRQLQAECDGMGLKLDKIIERADIPSDVKPQLQGISTRLDEISGEFINEVSEAILDLQ
jgi:hypothetical protein